jgi:hypothetical protein
VKGRNTKRGPIFKAKTMPKSNREEKHHPKIEAQAKVLHLSPSKSVKESGGNFEREPSL